MRSTHCHNNQPIMFMVSPANAVPLYTTYNDFEATSSQCEIDAMFDEMNIGDDLMCSPTSEKSFDGLSRSFRLKRSVCSLKGVNSQGCDIDRKNQCLVEAKQIEIDFASIASKSFMVRISAPNGEVSRLLEFTTYGSTDNFSPKMDGCGHGMWTFEVLQEHGSQIIAVASETMYLDGVGSLFFTVGDDFAPRLSSQEFLRLPSASRCCGRQRLLEQSA
ncbi:unnamed protein product [Toxocara canis]|uniref:Uncharacterized protein n=1 Tax=Toxocara canis TaxID=6265 RepID=A0A3P7GA26_TOXCA|nr:unnamed protein product [Toxocara canis]